MFNFPIMAIILAAILVIPVGISVLQQQQAYAPRVCPGCIADFKKLTHEFEKAVINAIGNPDATPADIRLLLDAYVQEVMPIFPPDPTLLRLLEDYQQGVMMIFETPPPDDTKAHDQIKDFKQLTNQFEADTLKLLCCISG